jgi:murein DD-endopeptidase MepM/ murein hydrolase activator NlpD
MTTHDFGAVIYFHVWRSVFVKRLSIVILLFVFLMTSIAPVMAVDLNSAKNEKSNVESRISKLNASKKKALEEKAKLEKQEKQVVSTQAAENNAYIELVDQVNAAQENLRQTENALADAQANYNSQRELVKIRLNVMYENSGSTVLNSFLESKSFLEFYERLHYMSLIAKQDERLINDLNTAKLDVEYKKKLQQDAKELLEQKVTDKQERLKKLKTSRAEVENQLVRSKAALAKLEKEEDALLAESQRLTNIIKNLSKSGKKYAGGTMIWPVPSSYNITSYFGMRKHPILRKYKMHTGIDIAASYGSSIVAANKGTVIIAGYDKSGYGNYVVIDHGGGIATLYGHCSKLLVEVGDQVKAGEVIAKIGSTGLSTGNHCHFEVRKNGVLKNPLSGYVSAK